MLVATTSVYRRTPASRAAEPTRRRTEAGPTRCCGRASRRLRRAGRLAGRPRGHRRVARTSRSTCSLAGAVLELPSAPTRQSAPWPLRPSPGRGLRLRLGRRHEELPLIARDRRTGAASRPASPAPWTRPDALPGLDRHRRAASSALTGLASLPTSRRGPPGRCCWCWRCWPRGWSRAWRSTCPTSTSSTWTASPSLPGRPASGRAVSGPRRGARGGGGCRRRARLGDHQRDGGSDPGDLGLAAPLLLVARDLPIDRIGARCWCSSRWRPASQRAQLSTPAARALLRRRASAAGPPWPGPWGRWSATAVAGGRRGRRPAGRRCSWSSPSRPAGLALGLVGPTSRGGREPVRIVRDRFPGCLGGLVPHPVGIDFVMFRPLRAG